MFNSYLLSNFGDTACNGIYHYSGEHDGYSFYLKNTNNYLLIYKSQYGPYSFTGAYYIEKIVVTNNSVPIYIPKYKSVTTNLTTTSWISLASITSDETTIGDLFLLDSSSSSSLDSSSSDSSSSQSESSPSSSSQSESSSSSGPIIRYVSVTGSDLNDGLSWLTAKGSIEGALSSSSNGDNIIVGDGTYLITSEISVAKEVSIYSFTGMNNTILQRSGASDHRVISLTVDNCLLSGFTIKDGYTQDIVGDGEGGNVYMSNASSLEDCIIEDGSGYEYGGNVIVDTVGSGASISRCIIRGGSTRYSAGGGGAIYISQPNCTVDNCLVYNNTSPSGGGMTHSLAATNSIINNCTITENTATGWNVGVIVYGGGYAAQQQGAFNNSIVWNNTPNDAAYIQFVSGASFEYNDVGVEQVIFGAAPSGAGRISSDPLFVNAGSDDFRIQSGSPCKNTGNSSLSLGLTDLDGNTRIVGGTIDMGSYEVQ